MSYRLQLVKEVIETLEAENAKLRDAVHVLVYCGAHVDCDGCPLNGNPYDTCSTVEWFACVTLREMIDELGVEVEESDVSAGLRVEDAERTQ